MVELVNAKKAIERVIQPMKRVKWIFKGWNHEPWIIYSDYASVMIVDIEKEVIHFFMADTYLNHRIVGHGCNKTKDKLTITLRLSPYTDTILINQMNRDRLGEVLIVIRQHPTTHQRLEFLEKLFLLASK